MNREANLSARGGFTLIELIMTLVILGFTLQLLIPFFQAIEHSADPIVRERTVALGQSLMDEILSKRWDENTPVGGGPLCTGEGGSGRGTSSYGVPLDCTTEVVRVAGALLGREGGETAPPDRRNWNDVDDYNGMSETDTFRDQAYIAFPLAGYRRSVVVDYVASDLVVIDKVTASAAGTTDTKRIRVTVSNPLGEQFVFVAVLCNF